MNYLEHPEVGKALDAVKAVRGDLAGAHSHGLNAAGKVLETELAGDWQNPLTLAEKVVTAYEKAVAERIGEAVGGQIQTQTVTI